MAAAAAITTVTIQLEEGDIEACLERHTIRAHGIPYAQADRFRPPGTVSRRSSALDCTRAATICPQNPSKLQHIVGNQTADREQSEACLHLTVTAPRSAWKAPVMVFFHGGAYACDGGDLDMFDGRGLVEQEGVIVVSVTNRLGIFGYLRVPGYVPANLGLLDQIAALEWIQDNIHSFGGDKTNITIFGQSSGADAVFCLLLSKHAHHLFHRVIIQSAPFGWYSDPRRQPMTALLGDYAQDFLDVMTDPSTGELVDLGADIQRIGQAMNQTTMHVFGTEFGQHPLPVADEVEPRLVEVSARIPLMIGWNRDEGTAYTDIQGPRTVQEVTRAGFVDGAQHFLNLIRQHHTAVSYELVWSPRGSAYGATHCLELPLLLGSWHTWQKAPMLRGERTEAAVRDLGVHVKRLWADFARGVDLGSRHFVIDGGFQYGSRKMAFR